MFPVEQAWMENPHRITKGKKNMARKRRKSKTASHKRVAVAAPRRKSRRRKAAVVAVHAVSRRRRAVRHNPPKHRRRRYHSNPSPSLLPSMSLVQDAGVVLGGYYGTKIGSGFIAPMVGIGGDLPRLAIKAAVAIGLSWVAGKAFGSRVQQNVLIGGAVETLQDAVKIYVSPFVPALAAADSMESYYLPDQPGEQGAVGSYYQVGNELPSDNYAG